MIIDFPDYSSSYIFATFINSSKRFWASSKGKMLEFEKYRTGFHPSPSIRSMLDVLHGPQHA